MWGDLPLLHGEKSKREKRMAASKKKAKQDGKDNFSTKNKN
jgi:hypothetical protein